MYYVQQQARFHLSMMQNIPEDFPVCEEFLNGIDKSEFLKAYRMVKQIFLTHYETAVSNPERYGLVCYSTDEYRVFGNEARESEFSLLWLPVTIFALTNAGIITGSKLVVSYNDFKDNLKGRKFKKLSNQIKFLEDCGFVFTEWNGKNFKSESFTVEYPNHPNVLKVLKSASDKVRALENNSKAPHKFDFYRITQYPHMLEMLFSSAGGELHPFDDSVFFRILNNETAAFLTEWNVFMKEQGLHLTYDDALLKNRYFNQKNKDTLNFIEYASYRRGVEGLCKVMLRLKLNHPGSYMEYIETLPDELKHSFKNVFCGHCTDNCSRRISYTIDGDKKECCGCFGFEFWYLTLDYIDFYKTLFLYERESQSN